MRDGHVNGRCAQNLKKSLRKSFRYFFTFFLRLHCCLFPSVSVSCTFFQAKCFFISSCDREAVQGALNRFLFRFFQILSAATVRRSTNNLVFRSPCTTLRLRREDRRRLNKAKAKTSYFVLLCLRLARLCGFVAKIGGASTKRKQKLRILFCFVFGLHDFAASSRR